MSFRPSDYNQDTFEIDDLKDLWPILSSVERVEAFNLLNRVDAEAYFLELDAQEQAMLLFELPERERRLWLRLLPPDDAADLVQEMDASVREEVLHLLDSTTQRDVRALLAYAEDEAGGLMNPRYVRLRPEMSVDAAIAYLRRQAREQVETIYYAYVLDPAQTLLGAVSFRELLSASPEKRVADVMQTELITVHESTDQEAVGRLFAESDLLAVPVLDDAGRMKGIVAVDDIVDVVQEEATEDIQKFGGMEAMDAPYLQMSFPKLVRKRASWLSVLFVGEMLTATVMAHYEERIARAVVLALFIPLIISSGGNSGSQSSTLIVRAMALGEVRLRDWWRVLFRELASGVCLGLILGTIGLLRILFWPSSKTVYGEHYDLIAVAVSVSLMGVVMWGTLSGALLPFLLRRLNFDPASASAPFVATLVDVTGLVIYFSVATLVLGGTLL